MVRYPPGYLVAPKKARAKCPSCNASLKRPRPIKEGCHGLGGCKGGRCSCGAVFVLDETGKNGGQALMDGLTLFCDGDVDQAITLQSGVDYIITTLNYDLDTHTFARSHDVRHSVRPRLWFITPIARD